MGKLAYPRASFGALVMLTLAGAASGLALAAPTLTVSWTAGGLDAGTFSAGQAARMAVDPVGNIAIVSGPSNATDLAVTSSRRMARSAGAAPSVPVSGYSGAIGWRLRSTATSLRSAATSPRAAIRSRSPSFASPATERYCGEWTSRGRSGGGAADRRLGRERISGVQLGWRRPGHPAAQVQCLRPTAVVASDQYGFHGQRHRQLDRVRPGRR